MNDINRGGRPAGIYTILGAGGIIAAELTKELLRNGRRVRLVSRQGKPQQGVTDAMAANLLDAQQTRKAVQGSAMVFLTAGLAYNHKIWAASWPNIMQHVIDACKEAGAPLIFFDNVYAYGLVNGPMKEDTPYNPRSRKGEIRARIATRLMDEVKAGNMMAAIARSADFYGPGADATGILNMLVINKLAKGQRASWLGRDDVPHSYTFTPDAGKGLYMLATDPAALNQVWHLPTCNPAPDGKGFVELVAKALGVPPKYGRLNGFMVRLAGLFNTTIGELYEMMYQNNYPYIFDSAKFEQHYNFRPVSYEKGIAQTVKR